MKRYFALIMSSVLLLSVVSCGKKPDDNNNNDDKSTEQQTSSVTSEIKPQFTANNTLEVLNKIWNAYKADEKFPALGGDYNHAVQNAPGTFDLSDKASLYSQLVCGESVAAKIDEASSIAHSMNANTFTAAVFRIDKDAKADHFVDQMRTGIKNNKWICGSPEVFFVSKLSDDYVISVFGSKEEVNRFSAVLKSVYSHVKVDIKSI